MWSTTYLLCLLPIACCAYCLLPIVPIANCLLCLLPIVHVKYHVPIVPFAIISKWITVCVNFTSSFSQEVAKRGPLCMRRCLVSHHFVNNYNEGKNFDNTWQQWIERPRYQTWLPAFSSFYTNNNIVLIENEVFEIVIARLACSSCYTNNNIVVIENEAFQIVTARSPDCFTLLSATHFADPKGSQFYV